jgi:hypothetical protein
MSNPIARLARNLMNMLVLFHGVYLDRAASLTQQSRWRHCLVHRQRLWIQLEGGTSSGRMVVLCPLMPQQKKYTGGWTVFPMHRTFLA